MGPDLELKGRSEIVVGASGNKENVGSVNEPETKHMECASTHEDSIFEMELMEALMDDQTEKTDRSQDVEVNILDLENPDNTMFVDSGIEHREGTENSSSFSDAELENGATLSDAEVESEIHGNTSSALPFDEYGEVLRMRRRRLTPHWRTFIRPLMWRCKWVELQILEFQSQAKKYDEDLAEYNQRKQFGSENCRLEGFGAKSFPFSGHSRRKEIMKRKKRKRVEDTVDVASYMSHHNLFSYYVKKRASADAASMDDDWGNREKTIRGNDEVKDELLFLEYINRDSSLDQILRNIDIVRSQVNKMKTRLHKVTSENASKFSSTDNLSLLASCNALTTSARNPASSHNDGDRMPVGSSHIANQFRTEHNTGDLVVPETATSSHGEVTHGSHIIESTVQPTVRSSKNIGDGDLIRNHSANNSKEVDF